MTQDNLNSRYLLILRNILTIFRLRIHLLEMNTEGFVGLASEQHKREMSFDTPPLSTMLALPFLQVLCYQVKDAPFNF